MNQIRAIMRKDGRRVKGWVALLLAVTVVKFGIGWWLVLGAAQGFDTWTKMGDVVKWLVVVEVVLTVIATAMAWAGAEGTGARPLIFWALSINAVLNIAWSGIFFKMRRPDWALREVVLLWFSVLSLVVVLGSVSTWAGVLLLPYLLWVSTAAFLNLRIVQMNPPFG